MTPTPCSALPPRMRAVDWAKSILVSPAVVVDVETTGIDPTAEIVDLCVLGMDGTVLLDQLVKPRRPIPAAAVAVHGITDELVADAPDWGDVYGTFADLMDGATLVGWNAEFDVGMIRRTSAAWGCLDPVMRWQDAMKAFGDFDGTPDHRFLQDRMRWWKLSEACDRLAIPANGFHRARADALACLAVVRTMAETETPS